VFCCATATAQEDFEAVDKRIFQEIREHNQVTKNLEYLSDDIGPRLTGSDELQKAAMWAADLARSYGLKNVHFESWKIAHSWRRGVAEARITAPLERKLTIASAGWSPGTAGQVRGRVVYVKATNVLAPMHGLNLIEPVMERYYGSDYASFNEVGVPGFAGVGNQPDYFRTHHSQADTFDKVQEEGVVQAAQLLAGWAYNTAELPELPPRN